MISNHIRAFVAAAAGIVGVAGCTSSQVGTYPVTHVNPATYGKLQFAVGWATGYGQADTTGAGTEFGYGVNFVETFRQSDGRSATLSNTPSIALPATLQTTLANLGEQTFFSSTNSGSTFLPGSALGSGFGLPLPQGVNQNPDYAVGGPPAFPEPALNSSSPQQTEVEGYAAFFPATDPAGGSGVTLPQAQTIYPGQYTLAISIPTGQTATTMVSQSATLAGKPLPAILTPSVAVDGNGGATVTVTIPAGVTETLVTITGDACDPANAPSSASPSATASPSSTASPVAIATSAPAPSTYTLISHVAGPAVDHLSLPDNIGPIGSIGRDHSLCTASDQLSSSAAFAFAVGFDYPAFESVYPQSFSETPTITGTTGQPDVTISPVLSFTSY